MLPLGIIADYTNDPILKGIELYIRQGCIKDLWTVYELFLQNRGWDLPTSLLEVSIHSADGANKYAPRNWEQGMPIYIFIDSATRHYIKYCRHDEDERHDRAFLWNILSAIWMHENASANSGYFDGMPFYDDEPINDYDEDWNWDDDCLPCGCCACCGCTCDDDWDCDGEEEADEAVNAWLDKIFGDDESEDDDQLYDYELEECAEQMQDDSGEVSHWHGPVGAVQEEDID